MNTYKTSDGDRVKKSIIDRRIREAKATKLGSQYVDHCYNFCEECGTSKGHLDCAHVISVNDCQKAGHAEKAWDINNIRILCRSCHAKYDNNQTKWTNEKNTN